VLRIAFAVLCIAAIGTPVHGQNVGMPSSSSPNAIVGGTLGMRVPAETPTIGASAGTEVLRHRDFTGKPCLAVGAFARSHTINPNLYDHVIVATNSCPQRIAIQVCYYGSQDCIPVEIPGDERKEAILGTLPGEKDFRFEFREKF
jgi:hypothetical protein